ncbi:15893_t:CDS:1, partial [Cetraspora pellucida]
RAKALIPKKRNLFLSNISSLIPKRPKLLNTRTKKRNFDLSSEQEKTPIIEAETANMPYLPNSKPSKSNNQDDENWASNIKQEKPVGKGKQKATSSTSKNNKIKNNKTHVVANTKNNKQTDTEHVHITHNKIDTQDKIADSTTSDD